MSPTKNFTTHISCDRNVCISNEYNGISCRDCEITKLREQLDTPAFIEEYKLYGLCPNCKAPLERHQNVCENCGQKVSWFKEF